MMHADVAYLVAPAGRASSSSAVGKGRDLEGECAIRLAGAESSLLLCLAVVCFDRFFMEPIAAVLLVPSHILFLRQLTSHKTDLSCAQVEMHWFWRGIITKINKY